MKGVIITNNIIKHIDSDFNTQIKKITLLAEQYPFLKVSNIGKSVLGRQIPLITFGKGENGILFSAAFHGNERITTNILLTFLEKLCQAFVTDDRVKIYKISEIIIRNKLYFVPIVNPDGCDISLLGHAAAGGFKDFVKRVSGGAYNRWSANARGVDINHNFSAGWEELHRLERNAGIVAPAPRRFGGAYPESEPETKALTEFCRTHQISYLFCFHSQGEVIYWKYKNEKIENSLKIATEMASLSGYLLDAPTGLAVGGGFKDWFISEFSKPAFTIEFGKGINPLPAESGAEIYKKTESMLIFLASL